MMTGEVQTDQARLLSHGSVKALLAANLVPIVGVAFFGWDVRAVLMIYWAESGVIALYTAIKMFMTAPLISLGLVPFFIFHFGMFMAGHLFFLIALTARGWDWETEGVEVELLKALNPVLAWAVAALIVSHGVSFYTHFIRQREYDIDRLMEELERRGKMNEDGRKAMEIVVSGFDDGKQAVALRFVVAMALMFAPYKRIVLMHLTLIVGGFALIALESAHWPLLILLIAGKTVVDLRAHAKEHRLTGKLKSASAGG